MNAVPGARYAHRRVDDQPPAPPSAPGKTAYKAITVGIVAALLGWCGSLLLAASPATGFPSAGR